MKKIKSILIAIREFFWPLLEKAPIKNPKLIKVEDVCVENENLQATLSHLMKIYESEEDRRRSIETKSSLFIGTISVITTVVLGVTTAFATQQTVNDAAVILVVPLIILAIYMIRTIWFSIEALQRRNYQSLEIKDILIVGKSNEYNKQIICKLANNIRQNYKTINAKVSSMTMAQEYFKRAILVIAIYAVVILLVVLFYGNANVHNFVLKVVNFLGSSSPGFWNSVVIYTLLIWVIILGRRVNIRLKSLSADQIPEQKGK